EDRPHLRRHPPVDRPAARLPGQPVERAPQPAEERAPQGEVEAEEKRRRVIPRAAQWTPLPRQGGGGRDRLAGPAGPTAVALQEASQLSPRRRIRWPAAVPGCTVATRPRSRRRRTPGPAPPRRRTAGGRTAAGGAGRPGGQCPARPRPPAAAARRRPPPSRTG